MLAEFCTVVMKYLLSDKFKSKSTTVQNQN